MIVWSRWGIFVVLCAGVGALIMMTVFSLVDRQPSHSGIWAGLGLVLGAVINWLFASYLLPRMDPPKPVLFRQPLAQPYANEHGQTVTFHVVQAVDPATGQLAFYTPRSSLFFIPVKYWTWILAAVGLLIATLSLVGSLVARH
ncbi:hypothetical protein [Psychromicrobium xiongbiense]|uniref:hypothetical protein n=1 Tax=Psychromicrobium xiongbiense TaxID=3051184 RepID=UPI00255305A1|nr:hypothetical protein [Psychromicrobium sp. YIM S02556]